jgi:hypothetical protein
MQPHADFPSSGLAACDRARRRECLSLTPRERLAAMQRLIDEAWRVLERHPDGLAHFRRRNFKARSVGHLQQRGHDGT